VGSSLKTRERSRGPVTSRARAATAVAAQQKRGRHEDHGQAEV